MTILPVSDRPLHEQKTGAFIICVPENGQIEPSAEFCAQWCPDFASIAREQKFSGQAGKIITIPVVKDNQVRYIIGVGLGKRSDEHISLEQYRRAIARGIKQAHALHIPSVSLALPSASVFGIDVQKLAQETASIIQMAGYHFNQFITDADQKLSPIHEVIVVTDTTHRAAVEAGVTIGMIIGNAVNDARHWVDLPPSDLTPPHLVDKARTIAQEHNLDLTVFSEKDIINMGMGGLSGVSRGSDQDCQLAIMQYHAADDSAPTVAIVGKGITFDSGGLSLKPPQYMETMKEDMSGAAAVIATMQAIAQLKPSVHVIAVTPLAENLPSAKATKPGDIVRFYNGKTAEVKNTDAEGRLILADALSYTVEHYKPDAIIDIATLTGACAHAYGPFFSGLMSQHDALAEKVVAAGMRSGDRVWRMPMDNDYAAAIKSSVADLCNIGSNKYMAGAITAAFFLKPFVGETPWVHLDIAGTAFDVPDVPYYRPGATGVGVRLFVDLIMNW